LLDVFVCEVAAVERHWTLVTSWLCLQYRVDI